MHTISYETLRELLIEKNMTDKQAADFLGVSRMTISRRRAELGINQKPKRPEGFYDITSEEESILKKLYEEGKNDYEVAAVVKRGRGTLREWREKNGIKSKTNKKGLDKNICSDIYKYIEDGKTFTDIASIYGVTRTSITKLYKKQGYIYDLYRQPHPSWVGDYKLTDVQKSVLIGELFGDGGMYLTSKESSVYQFSHTNNQEFFVKWKIKMMAPLISRVSGSSSYAVINAGTYTAPCLGYWCNIFYPNGATTKTMTPEFVGYLDDLSLATWYMGDGKLSRKKRASFTVGLQIKLEPVCDKLIEKFDIIFRADKYKREYNLVVIDTDKFFDRVSKYIIPGFEYKVPEKYKKQVGLFWENKDIYNIDTKSFKMMDSTNKERIINGLVDFYSKRGFPYPRYNKTVIRQESRSFIKNSTKTNGDVIFSDKVGTRICSNYFPHRYDDRRYNNNPMENWTDPIKFREFIKNRLTYAESKITDAVIRTGMQLKGLPANFNPSVAKHVYNTFLPINGDALDFSSGYGGRLLGFLGNINKGTYTGVEPYTKSFEGLNRMADDCCRFFNMERDKINLINKPFEDVTFNESRFDLIFSSPPYYSLELYGDESTQSSVRYPSYELWLKNFWTTLSNNCYRYLKSGGHFIYSIGNYENFDLIKDTTGILDSIGFKYDNTLKMSYHNVYQNKDKLESIFIYKKL